ncbi:MAG TPA: RuBisCO large subunit C-terminal-like domain-containing protein [Gammaproteobacteria bacterium]|nr:RuBisCO large subunit C-terminal-like domain-containing protein [Gammaproteobacteria bacterium]
MPSSRHPRVSSVASVTGQDERLSVTYRLFGDHDRVETLARQIALEQSVELPESQVPEDIRRQVVGRVEEISPDPGIGNARRATISYAARHAGTHLSQLLNLVFGNVSIYPRVRLLDLGLPQGFLDGFRGPRYGIGGLRALTGVHDRPLLATALKPKGAAIDTLAGIARDFALGGGDIVKDDQNLADDFEIFKHRVEACARAVDEANTRTGRRCLYFPNIAAPAGELDRYLDYVATLGLHGVLICPMIVGLETTRDIAARHSLVLMAHPALTGSYTQSSEQGIDHGLLLGTLFRMAGADISIFPNSGGRFSYTREQCLAIAGRLREPLGTLAPAWPSPGGGMAIENLDAMGADYGADAVFLTGGALFALDPELRDGTHAFMHAIRARFEERLTPPSDPAAIRSDDAVEIQRYFPFEKGFEWKGRASSPYKDAADLAFKGVRRVELVGKFGERTHCDLRYFEVQPGGYTSQEKHLHTHIIIGARGEAVLAMGNRRFPFRQHDIAYIAPLEVHQLVNDGDEPFGFYCVVDHDRDRPMGP